MMWLERGNEWNRSEIHEWYRTLESKGIRLPKSLIAFQAQTSKSKLAVSLIRLKVSPDGNAAYGQRILSGALASVRRSR